MAKRPRFLTLRLLIDMMPVDTMFAEETIYLAAAAFEGGMDWKGITA